jgi:prepilin-type N-terminal cleavage/methylation domain-containing protein
VRKPTPIFSRVRIERPCGFTLVELLVVIGIVALLIAILLPALNRARAAGKSVACLNHTRQLATAQIMTAVQNGGYLRPGYSDTFGDGFDDWSMALVRYNGPLGGTRLTQQSGSSFPSPPWVLRCTVGTNRDTSNVSIWGWRERVGYVSHYWAVGYGNTKERISRQPPNRAMILEKSDFTTFGGNENTSIYFALNNPRELIDRQYLWFPHPNQTQNVAFMDGSAQAVRRGDFIASWTPAASGGRGGAVGGRYFYNQSGARPAAEPYWIDVLR